MLDFNAIFGRTAPIVLEIGFGDGAALAQIAEAEPEKDFIGIEVHRPGVGHLLRLIDKHGLTNLRIFCHDAVEVLDRQIPVGSLDRVQVYFPDPWPTKRHHKRRLIQPVFVHRLAERLRAGGLLHLATDWEDYARQMLDVLDGEKLLENTANDGGYTPRPAWRPKTKFERRGLRLGHDTWDLVFRRRDTTGAGA